MYYKITNLTDVECLKRSIKSRKDEIKQEDYNMFLEVMSSIENNINILSENYGDKRNSDRNLGGYLLLFTSTKDKELLNVIYERYGINQEYAEFEDVLAVNEKMKWISRLFIISSDYSVVIVTPILKNDTEQFSLVI